MSNNSFDYEKLLKDLQKKVIKVGLPQGAGEMKSKKGVSVVEYGAINEFGVGVERRSFIKDTFEIKNNQLQTDMQKVFNNETNRGNFDADKIMNIIGATSQGYVDEAFETGGFGRWAPNAPITIKLKGSSEPLIDTGLLRQSITFIVEDD